MSAFTYDDFLLIPQYSEIESRSLVDTEFSVGRLTGTVPVVPAPMDSIFSIDSMVKLVNQGFPVTVHRFMPYEEQIDALKTLKSYAFSENTMIIGCIGAKGSKRQLMLAEGLIESGANVILIDVAHGDHKSVITLVREFKKMFPDTMLMAGNVATPDGALRLACAGADIIRVGVGNGSVCTTRLQTGHGVPQAYAVKTIADAIKSESLGRRVYVCADGGMKHYGDIAKALAVGADFTMSGRFYAGVTELASRLPVVEKDGVSYFEYRGMASAEAKKDAYGKVKHVEGVATLIPLRGSIEQVMQEMQESIASAFSYSGARDIQQFKRNAQILPITSSSIIENYPHATL